ncbi:MAG: hypothetical protein DI528_15685 [Shinella sp.]|nr:MAG: hypothetical protein DI528_15685 [Shinella sp.]
MKLDGLTSAYTTTKFLFLSSGLALFTTVAAAQTVTLNSPGGQVRDGGDAAVWGPAAKSLGIDLRVETSDDSFPVLRMEAASNASTTDIFLLSSYNAELAQREGLLEPIDKSQIAVNDFLPGTVTDYCVGLYGYANVMSWNTKTFGQNPPKNWADFWNVKDFPGSRAIRSIGDGMVEAALMADGVEAGEVYKVLRTEEGLQRAIDKLAELKPSVKIWWSSGAQQIQFMTDGEIDAVIGYNGRMQTVKSAGGSVDYTFKGGSFSFDCFAIAKGSKNKEAAMKLIAAMSTPEAHAGMTKFHTYGPLNLKAYDTGLIAPEVEAILPTNKANAENLLVMDNVWYADFNDKMAQMYEDMMTE